MVEALLRDRLASRSVEAVVHSAGLLRDGAPASDGSVRAMAARGLDISDHVSRVVTEDMVRPADLVIGLAREHVREAAVLTDDGLARTFTLRELARRAEEAGPRQTDEALDAYLARVGEGRRATDLLGASAADDVADPIGGSRRRYERTAQEIEALVDAVVAHLFPLPCSD